MPPLPKRGKRPQHHPPADPVARQLALVSENLVLLNERGEGMAATLQELQQLVHNLVTVSLELKQQNTDLMRQVSELGADQGAVDALAGDVSQALDQLGTSAPAPALAAADQEAESAAAETVRPPAAAPPFTGAAPAAAPRPPFAAAESGRQGIPGHSAAPNVMQPGETALDAARRITARPAAAPRPPARPGQGGRG